jgi:hypothetical protein
MLLGSACAGSLAGDDGGVDVACTRRDVPGAGYTTCPEEPPMPAADAGISGLPPTLDLAALNNAQELALCTWGINALGGACVSVCAPCIEDSPEWVTMRTTDPATCASRLAASRIVGAYSVDAFEFCIRLLATRTGCAGGCVSRVFDYQ